MIIIGISCQRCGGTVLDNPTHTACHKCHEPYGDKTLDLIKIHHQAKMNLVAQMTNDPNKIVKAIIALAKSSTVAATLY